MLFLVFLTRLEGPRQSDNNMPTINNKIYWYEKSNGEIFDCNEFAASKVHGKLKYIGWSDGIFVKEMGKIQLTKNNKPPKGSKEKIEAVIKKEIEFAKTNEDRTPPRDFSRETIPSQQDPTGNKALDALGRR